MASQRAQQFSRRQLQKNYGVVICAGERFSIRGILDAAHPVGGVSPLLTNGALQSAQHFARRRIPYLYDMSATSRRQRFSIGRIAETSDRIGMNLQGVPQFSRRRVPNFGGVIISARSQSSAIGRVGDDFDALGVALRGAQQLARLHVPHSYGVIRTSCARVVPRRSEGFSIGGKRDAADSAAMSLQCSQQLPRRHIPELNSFVATCRSQGFAIGRIRHAIDRIGMPQLHHQLRLLRVRRGEDREAQGRQTENCQSEISHDGS